MDLTALRKMICGSDTLGQYGTTEVNNARHILSELAGLKAQAGVTSNLTGSTTAPTYLKVDSIKVDCAEQAGNRWLCNADGRYRSLAEMWQQIANDIGALPDDTSAPVVPSADLPAGTQKGVLQWKSDNSQPDVLAAGYKKTVHNRQAKGQQIGQSGPPWPPPIVDGVGGRRAIKFNLPKDGMRIEVEPNHRSFADGDDAWFGFSFYLGPDFPLATSSWQVIWQLHGNDTTSPHQDIQCHKGGLTIADNKWMCPVQKEKWYRCVVHAQFNAGGTMSVWLDGTNILNNYDAGKNRGPAYLKCGYYSGDYTGGTIYQTDHRLGTGYGAVA